MARSSSQATKEASVFWSAASTCSLQGGFQPTEVYNSKNKSGVNLRTLQQYELKTKDIGKASVQTVIALAAVLGCPIEDLLEYAENDSEA